VRRQVGPQHADDVTAETFVTAFAVRGRFDLQRDSARPWLMGIAVKQISRRWRAERARLTALATLEAGPVQPRGPDEVPDAAFARTVDSLLAAAMRSLKRGDRDVLLLIAWAELEYAEVAEALRIPVGTVRSRLHRARRSMRTALTTSN
jgi:RNA polymerase sigma-70 factor (ECF subfamily)